MKAWRRLAAAAAIASLGPVLSGPALAQAKKPKPAPAAPAAAAASAPAGPSYAERFGAVCAACHGANGRSERPGVPVLAGQPSLYVITQLFLFREGRRNNEAMIALAKQMSDNDLRGFSDFIGTLAPVPAPPPAAPLDAARMRLGQALAREHKCTFCHGDDLAGGKQVPRIGGQKEEYLSQTLHGFKTGQRPGYTRAMTEALSQVAESDLDTLAYFAAHIGSR